MAQGLIYHKTQPNLSLVGWDCKIHWQHLYRATRTPQWVKEFPLDCKTLYNQANSLKSDPRESLGVVSYSSAVMQLANWANIFMDKTVYVIQATYLWMILDLLSCLKLPTSQLTALCSNNWEILAHLRKKKKKRKYLVTVLDVKIIITVIT